MTATSVTIKFRTSDLEVEYLDWDDGTRTIRQSGDDLDFDLVQGRLNPELLENVDILFRTSFDLLILRDRDTGELIFPMHTRPCRGYIDQFAQRIINRKAGP
jgi:hypothetical protein